MMERRESGPRLATPFTLSALLHAAIATLLFYNLRERKQVALPPMYRVNIVAAPPGERAIGEVKTQPSSASTSVTPPTAAQSTPKELPPPRAKPAPKTPARVTPAVGKVAPTPKASAPKEANVAPKKTEAPKAGGGPTGGKGTDVATVRSDGIEFPFPGYLNNIVRQIALNFKPRNASSRLKAEVRFLIHRDGSVSDLTFVRRSGDFSFDLEAQGAVEAASSSGSFGPLPTGFSDDVLPVVFSFDPEFLK
ncbi:MAG TPA: TonB C-terminal domain-containing protein [Gemmatimonadaceae bacterium]